MRLSVLSAAGEWGVKVAVLVENIILLESSDPEDRMGYGERLGRRTNHRNIRTEIPWAGLWVQTDQP